MCEPPGYGVDAPRHPSPQLPTGVELAALIARVRRCDYRDDRHANRAGALNPKIAKVMYSYLPQATIAAMWKRKPEQISEMSDADRIRVRRVLEQIAKGPKLSSRPLSYLEVWITEHRMTAERRATHRLALATWVLAFTTAALVAATFVLAYVTAHHGG